MGVELGRTFKIFAAFSDILRIFADTEIGGQYELDYDAIANYVESIKGISDYFECTTKEEIYDRFTQDIYNGLPVWRFLKLPEWTMNMVEKSFTSEMSELYEAYKIKYKCLTCKYINIRETCAGILYKCNYHTIQNSKRQFGREHRPSCRSNEPFELKETCEKYEPLATEGDENG